MKGPTTARQLAQGQGKAGKRASELGRGSGERTPVASALVSSPLSLSHWQGVFPCQRLWRAPRLRGGEACESAKGCTFIHAPFINQAPVLAGIGCR